MNTAVADHFPYTHLFLSTKSHPLMERNECDAKGALRYSGTLKEKEGHKGAFATPFRMLSLKETKRDNVVI